MPRKYNIEKRVQFQEQTRRKILDAALKLHAKQGGLQTTHAEIAQLADVAIPTVYKYFPDINKLAEGCTAHAMERAPMFGVEIFDGLAKIDDRLEALTKKVFALYDYLHPWLRWGEDRRIPEVKAVKDQGAQHVLRMLELACDPNRKSALEKTFCSLATMLLSYASYEELTKGQRISTARAVASVSQALTVLFRAKSS